MFQLLNLMWTFHDYLKVKNKFTGTEIQKFNCFMIIYRNILYIQD